MLLGLNTGNLNGLSGNLLSQTRYKGGLRFNGLFGPWGDFTEPLEKPRLVNIIEDAFQFSQRKVIVVCMDGNLATSKAQRVETRNLLFKGIPSGDLGAWSFWFTEFNRVLSRLEGLQERVQLSLFNGPECYGTYYRYSEGAYKPRLWFEFIEMCNEWAFDRGWHVLEPAIEQRHIYVHNEQMGMAGSEAAYPVPHYHSSFAHTSRLWVTECGVHRSFSEAERPKVLDWLLGSVAPRNAERVYLHDPFFAADGAGYGGAEYWGKAVLDRRFPVGALG